MKILITVILLLIFYLGCSLIAADLAGEALEDKVEQLMPTFQK